MIKKLSIILLLFLMTGCWNYQELNNISISTAIAIDMNEDNEYEVSTLIANSRKSQTSSQESESQSVIYTGKGKTISEAFKDIDLYNPRKNYIGHVAVLVISEEVAQKGLKNILDFFARNSESTRRFQMIIAKDDKAKDIIKILTPLETYSAQDISSNLRYSKESQATSISILYSDFIYNLLEKGYDPILPSVILKGDKKNGSKDKSLQQTVPDAFIKIDNLAIFKDDKLMGFASKDESRGINLLKNSINELTINTKLDDEYIAVKLTQSITKNKIKFKDKPIIEVVINSNALITEDNTNHNLEDEKVIKEIEKKIKSKIKSLANKGLKVSQKYKSDIFGYGNLIYKNYPKYFGKIDNWNNEYQDLEVNIKVNVNIDTIGTSQITIKEAKNEN